MRPREGWPGKKGLSLVYSDADGKPWRERLIATSGFRFQDARNLCRFRASSNAAARGGGTGARVEPVAHASALGAGLGGVAAPTPFGFAGGLCDAEIGLLVTGAFRAKRFGDEMKVRLAGLSPTILRS